MLGIQPNKIAAQNNQVISHCGKTKKKGEVFALDDVCPHVGHLPLSDGWIHAKRNTITCRFMRWSLTDKGRLYQKVNTFNGLPNLWTIFVGDCIWTYGMKPGLRFRI